MSEKLCGVLLKGTGWAMIGTDEEVLRKLGETCGARNIIFKNCHYTPFNVHFLGGDKE